jgi:hypothetical protein
VHVTIIRLTKTNNYLFVSLVLLAISHVFEVGFFQFGQDVCNCGHVAVFESVGLHEGFTFLLLPLGFLFHEAEFEDFAVAVFEVLVLFDGEKNGQRRGHIFLVVA